MIAIKESEKNNLLRRHLYNILKSLILIISCITSLYIYYNTRHEGYEFLFLLPLVFAISFILFLSPLLYKNNNVFIMVFSVVAFFRYTVLPFLIVYSSYYGGRSEVPPSANSYTSAICLMIYELAIISFVIFLLFRKVKKEKKETTKYLSPNNNFVYILFIFFSIGMLIISPSSIRYFSIISPSDSTLNLGEGSTLNSLTFFLLLTAKYLVFLMLMSKIYKRYLASKKKIYVILSLVVVLINISIIFGSNRADFIIPAIASFVLFYKLYPKYGKLVGVIFGICIVSITVLISNERSLVSYTGGTNTLIDTTDMLQIYLGGPYNVAIASEIEETHPEQKNIGYFLYDMLRPTIGLNMILKQYDIPMSSYIYNERIFFTDQRSHNIPIIGQGHLYFGFIFSPIIFIFFVILVRFFVDLVNRQRRVELVFFLTIPIARIGLAMGQNGTILMNDISFFLVLSLTIYYLNNKFVLKKNSKRERNLF